MDRFQAMTIFTRVVETHSFKKAAATLSLPPSTVTKAVKDLESYLGARLLLRTTRKLSLTTEGSLYYDRCRAILADLEVAEAAFFSDRTLPRGKVRVDMPASLARLHVIPHLADFRRSYPDVELTLSLSDRVVDLVQEGIDCVVRSGVPQSSATLITRRIAGFKWVVCASPNYLAQNGEPTSIADLRDHQAVGYLSSRTGRALDWFFLEAGERQIVQMNATIIVNDTDAYVAAGVEGLGLIRAASYLVHPYLRDGQLHQVLADVSGPVEPLSIMYPRNRHLTPAVRVFVDWCAATMSRLSRSWVDPIIEPPRRLAR